MDFRQIYRKALVLPVMIITYPYFSAIHMPKPVTPRKLATKAISKLNKLRTGLMPVTNDIDVHQFRVQFKKTRAFFRMANAVEESNNHRIKKSWRKIYQVTGERRDLEIIITVAGKQFGDGNLMNYLQQKKGSIESRLQLELKTGKPFTLCSKKWKKFTTAALNAYFEKLLQPIRGSYRLALTDHLIHEIRKKLKDLLYNIGWLEAMHINYPPAISGICIAVVEQLLELLGNFQDGVALSVEFRQLQLVPELHDTAKAIDVYLDLLAQDQDRLYKAIVRQLEHAFHLHAPRTLDE